MSLHGSLTDFGLPEVFQLIAQQGKSGVLEVKSGGVSVEVAFRSGRVVRAGPTRSRPDEALADLLIRTGALTQTQLEAARSEQGQCLEPLPSILERQNAVSRADLEQIAHILTNETIFDLFRRDEGTFRFRPEDVQPVIGDQEVGADHVLLDAVRMKDEWPLIESRLPTLSHVPVALVDAETFRGRRGSAEGSHGISEAVLEQVFMLVNGRYPARRVIDLTRLGTFEGARALVALERAEMIRFDRPARGSRYAERPRAETSTPSAVVPALLVLALATALTGTLWLRTPSPTAAIVVPSDTLAAARAGVYQARIRHALEVERWVSGQYPRDLSGIERGIPDLLASGEGDRYSYARVREGYTLYRIYP